MNPQIENYSDRFYYVQCIRRLLDAAFEISTFIVENTYTLCLIEKLILLISLVSMALFFMLLLLLMQLLMLHLILSFNRIM